jgi:hypothetical protein
MLCILDSLEVTLLPERPLEDEEFPDRVEYPEEGIALTLLEDNLELFLAASPLAESGDEGTLSLVVVPGEVEVLGLTALPEERVLREGIDITFPVVPVRVFPEFRLAEPGISLVLTMLLVEEVLPVFPDTAPADPRESLKLSARGWAGLSLVMLVLPALVAEAFLLLPVAARDARLDLEMFSGRPALKLLLTFDGRLLTMVDSTRRREKSVALTTVMPLLLLLFITTVVLLIMVLFGRLPCPQALGDHPI